MPYELRSVLASLPQVERGVAKILAGDPKGINFLYTNGKSVVIRDIQHPEIADIYTEHTHPALVAKYCPSGFYIASGDATGHVRIWDTTQKEHILKYEYQPFVGPIKDLAWTEDGKRIAVVGEGRDRFGAVFLWDSGSSVGEIIGHTKIVNSVAIRQVRPYRLVTGSDDNSAAFFHGLPFKFQFTLKNHTRFVNCVRFSPDGSHLATASADGKIIIYDGKTGEMVCGLGGDKAHDGGIYAVSWSPDGSQLLSASGDRSARLWDVAKATAISTFSFGSNIVDQQLGCLWQGDYLLSLSMDGRISYLDPSCPTCPHRVIHGHTKSIQCLTVHKPKTIISASHDGHMISWDAENGVGSTFKGQGHTNQVCGMGVEDGDLLLSCGMDDTLRFSGLSPPTFHAEDMLRLEKQPNSLAVGPDGYAVVLCIEQLVLLKNRKKVYTLSIEDYAPQDVDLHPSGDTVAVGGDDSKVHLYSIDGNVLCTRASPETLDVPGPVMSLAYSPDGSILAVVNANKVITTYQVADGYKEHNNYYGHHAKPVSLAWCPDNQHFATSGMDCLVYVWNVDDTEKWIKITDAHRMYHISSLAWLDSHTLVTTSQDTTVKQWTINY
uniref:WD repeat-containing protein 1 n=1 Tax=Myxine glutinosa TaxID=7769 RepID=UPI00358DF9B6